MENLPALLLDSQRLLQETNLSLRQEGYEIFWLGGTNFNTNYRVNPVSKFRLVWRWFPPGLALSELYLIHLPTNTEVTVKY